MTTEQAATRRAFIDQTCGEQSSEGKAQAGATGSLNKCRLVQYRACGITSTGRHAMHWRMLTSPQRFSRLSSMHPAPERFAKINSIESITDSAGRRCSTHEVHDEFSCKIACLQCFLLADPHLIAAFLVSARSRAVALRRAAASSVAGVSASARRARRVQRGRDHRIYPARAAVWTSPRACPA
jgi:hypothetical protein